MAMGQLRDAGNTFFADSTENVDIVHNRFLQKRIEIANDPSDVETRLQAQVVMKRVRIEEFFIDYDKLRKMKVTRHQFEAILSMLNFKLTKEEFNALADKYKTADGMFNYKDFCANINSAFTTYGIQKQPQAQVKPVTVDMTQPARVKTFSMSPDEEALISGVLGEMQKAIQIKRIHLTNMF
jgi:hypothetical protein